MTDHAKAYTPLLSVVQRGKNGSVPIPAFGPNYSTFSQREKKEKKETRFWCKPIVGMNLFYDDLV